MAASEHVPDTLYINIYIYKYMCMSRMCIYIYIYTCICESFTYDIYIYTCMYVSMIYTYNTSVIYSFSHKYTYEHVNRSRNPWCIDSFWVKYSGLTATTLESWLIREIIWQVSK